MLNNTKHFILILFLIVYFVCSIVVYAAANKLVLVYPRNGATISADSTFFVGNTNPKATLTINGKPVKVYANGAFVRVYNLQKGKNLIVLRSVLNNEVKEKKIILNVPHPSKSRSVAPQPKLKPLDAVLQVIVDETPLRETPYGNRLTPVKKDVIFKTQGLLNKHYKVSLGNGKYAYIAQSSAKVSNIQKLAPQVLNSISFNEDAKNVIIKIPMDYPTITELSTEKNIIKVRLLNTKQEFQNYSIKSPYVKSFDFNNDNFSIEFLSNNFNGYDYFYEDNNFILKIRKPFKRGLRGKTIAIDAGHGGKELHR